MPQDSDFHNAGKILHLESLTDLNHKMQGIRFFKIEKWLFGFHLLPCWKQSIEEILEEVSYPRIVSLDSPSG